MPMDRMLPDPEAKALVDLVAEIARRELAPRASEAEAHHAFPRDAFTLLGRSGFFAMPIPDQWDGLGQPYEVFLQALEEVATSWISVGVGCSVHVMTSLALINYGTEEQRQSHLPDIVGGELLGAFALSEQQAGSDVRGMTTRAVATGDGYRLSGGKAWITHAGQADYYLTFARTGDHPTRGVSCFLVPSGAPGLTFGQPERKLGMTASVTGAVYFDDVEIAADRLIGEEGQGLTIALSCLDSGRIGIAACATGLGQAALDVAVAYAKERQQFGRAIADFQGLQFLLADMAAAVELSRASYLNAARRRDAGLDYRRAAAVAKLSSTDAAMKVTTEAIQVLGGYGYTSDFPVERFFREAKAMQIFEGTNQIQRAVIAKDLLQ